MRRFSLNGQRGGAFCLDNPAVRFATWSNEAGMIGVPKALVKVAWAVLPVVAAWWRIYRLALRDEYRRRRDVS